MAGFPWQPIDEKSYRGGRRPKKPDGPGARAGSCRVYVESLEDRTLLTDVWTGAQSASWSDGGNWSSGAHPALPTSPASTGVQAPRCLRSRWNPPRASRGYPSTVPGTDSDSGKQPLAFSRQPDPGWYARLFPGNRGVRHDPRGRSPMAARSLSAARPLAVGRGRSNLEQRHGHAVKRSQFRARRRCDPRQHRHDQRPRLAAASTSVPTRHSPTRPAARFIAGRCERS